MKPTLLVLAAGMGSRYGGLKQIDPVGPNGEIIIDYSVFDAVQAGFGKVVFVIRKDIEAEFKQSIGARYSGVIDIEYAFQDLTDLPGNYSVPQNREKPWGTGQAILAARQKIKEPFAAINADDFYGRSAYQLLSAYLDSAVDGAYADYAMVGFVLGKTLSDHGSVSRGVCQCDGDGFVTELVERKNIFRKGNDACYVDADGTETRLSGDTLVSMNFWGFTPSIFDHLDSELRRFLDAHGKELKSEFLIPTVTGTLIRQGAARLTMLKSADPWFGITYREDKALVAASIQKMVDAGAYPTRLFS